MSELFSGNDTLLRVDTELADLSEPIDFEIETPLSHWVKGSETIPRRASRRATRLMYYQALDAGNFALFLPARDRLVTPNMFSMAVSWYCDLLLSRPPEIEHGIGNDLLDARFLYGIDDVIYDCLYDYLRYGTALLQVFINNGAVSFRSPQPIFYYPAENGAALVSNSADDSKIVFVDYGQGRVNIDIWKSAGGKLSKNISSNKVQIGNADGWRAFSDLFSYQPLLIQSSQRRYSTGNWGASFFENAWSPVFEFMRRSSQMSEILNEHGNPKIRLEPDDTAVDFDAFRRRGGGASARTGGEGGGGSADARYDELRIQRFVDSATGRETAVVQVPRGYKSIDYMIWPGNLREHLAAAQIAREEALSAFYLTSKLWGYQSAGGGVVSGLALALDNLRTSAHIQGMQYAIKSLIRRGLIVAAIASGATYAQCIRYNADLVIKWRNLFDASVLIDEASQTREGVEAASMERAGFSSGLPIAAEAQIAAANAPPK